MANGKEFFLSVVQRIFSNWTALRMAVEYGNGPKERAMDFGSYMTEILYLNEQLSIGEIAEELEDYMDNYFNTELEDGSAIQVAEELLRFYKYRIEGNQAIEMAEFDKLPPLQLWIQPNVPAAKKVYQNNDSSSESDDQMDTEPKQAEVADTEWTVIKNRRKR